VGQHLVGPICLLIGIGSAAVIRRLAHGENTVRRAGAAVCVLLLVIGLIGPPALVLAPSAETKRDFTVRQFVRGAMNGISPGTTIAVIEDTAHADILSRWYIHEGSHPILWGVGINGLDAIRSRPLLIVSSPIELDGLDRRIARQMGAAPSWEESLPVPKQVGYLFMDYSNR